MSAIHRELAGGKKLQLDNYVSVMLLPKGAQVQNGGHTDCVVLL